jgi:hypothetical protein
MKRMILIALLLGFLMGSVVWATCYQSADTCTDPNDPNTPAQEIGLPSRSLIWLDTVDPNDPNTGGE